MRVFVAVALPPDVAARVARTLPDLQGARRVGVEQLHLTLAFIGQLDAARLADVTAALHRAARRHMPFHAALSHLGRFPDHGAPTILWIGVDRGSEPLAALASSVRAELTLERVPLDAKPFRPHITLARVRDADARRTREIVAALDAAPPAPIPFQVDTLTLFESVLSPKGARYTARAAVPLDAGVGGRGEPERA